MITTPPAIPGTGPIAESHVQMHGSNVPNNMQEDVVAFNAVSATMFDNDRLRYGCFAAWETLSWPHAIGTRLGRGASRAITVRRKWRRLVTRVARLSDSPRWVYIHGIKFRRGRDLCVPEAWNVACTRGKRLRTLACMCAQRTMLQLLDVAWQRMPCNDIPSRADTADTAEAAEAG